MNGLDELHCFTNSPAGVSEYILLYNEGIVSHICACVHTPTPLKKKGMSGGKPNQLIETIK